MSRLRSALGLGRSLAIYYGRPWRHRRLARFYAQFLRPGDLAFDIGAHVGSRTRAMRAAGARVVALEPQAPFAGFLRRTLPADVILCAAAAGPTETRAQLAVSRLHPTVSSLAGDFPDRAGTAPGFGHVRWDARQEVEVTTLDALIARHGLPQLIKIDVEGFEDAVLEGLSQPVAVVALEYLPGLPQAAQRAVQKLARLGRYRFNAVDGESRAFRWHDWQEPPAVLDWLSGLAPDAPSGDLYARLEPAA